MRISEIVRELLATSEVVHDAKNIELQNYTNDLTDEQLNVLWEYAIKRHIPTYLEEEDGFTARFISQSELERLVPTDG